jgi:hypothetical protein
MVMQSSRCAGVRGRLSPPRASSRIFCYGYFEEESMEVEDDDFSLMNFHPRSVLA